MSDFPFKVGDKVVHENEATPGFHITVASADFPGPYGSYREFAGIDSNDNCLKVYSTTGLRLYVEPPKRRTWTFETEDRQVRQDDMYVDPVGSARLISAHRPGPRSSSPWPVIVPGSLREVTP